LAQEEKKTIRCKYENCDKIAKNFATFFDDEYIYKIQLCDKHFDEFMNDFTKLRLEENDDADNRTDSQE
jgi:hypothetical protein